MLDEEFNLLMGSFLDQKLNGCITSLLENSVDFFSTPADLDTKVNSEETLRQYIRNTEKEFGLEPKNVDDMIGDELTNYVKHLDMLWG